MPVVIVASLLTALAWSHLSSYFFLLDDSYNVTYAANHSLAQLLTQSVPGIYRPTAYLIWHLIERSFDFSAFAAFAWTNFLTHIANALLLATALRRAGLPVVTAMAASTLFLAWPPLNEGVYWVTGGHDTFLVFFALLATHAGIASVKASSRLESRLWLGLYFAAMLLAQLAKEYAFLFVPLQVLLGYRALAAPRRYRRLFGLAAAGGGALAVFLVARAGILGDVMQTHYGKAGSLFHASVAWNHTQQNLRALTMLRFVADDATTWTGNAARLICLAAMVAAWGYRPRRWLLGGLMLSLVATMAGLSWTTAPVGEAYGGRLLYFPSLLLCLIMALGWTTLWQARQARAWRRAIAAALTAVLAACLWSDARLLRHYEAATRLSRHIVDTVSQHWQEGSHLHVRNLPFLLQGGPHLLKCYAFRYILGARTGRDVRVRCDLTAIGVRDGAVVEVIPRQIETRVPAVAGEISLELSYPPELVRSL